MAVTQENVAQQPPAPAQPEQAPSPGPDAPTDEYNAAQSPAPQPIQDSTAGSQAPSADLGFSQILEQHIAQAIQPVLDEFRQQMEQEVAQQAGTGRASTSEGQVAAPKVAQGPAAQPPTQQPPTQQPPVQSTQPEATAQQATASQPQQAPPASLSNQVSAQTPAVDQHVAERPLAGALAPAVQAVEHHGAQWLQSLLIAGLGALLSESTRAAAQQRAEQGLNALLQRLFDAAPDGVATPEMQGKIERTLQLILRDSVDAVFAEGVRTTVQQGGQQTIQQSLHGDFRAALTKVEDTLRVMLDALIAVLRRHQQTILRLLLALALLALENSLVQPEKAK